MLLLYTKQSNTQETNTLINSSNITASSDANLTDINQTTQSATMEDVEKINDQEIEDVEKINDQEMEDIEKRDLKKLCVEVIDTETKTENKSYINILKVFAYITLIPVLTYNTLYHILYNTISFMEDANTMANKISNGTFFKEKKPTVYPNKPKVDTQNTTNIDDIIKYEAQPNPYINATTPKQAIVNLINIIKTGKIHDNDQLIFNNFTVKNFGNIYFLINKDFDVFKENIIKKSFSILLNNITQEMSNSQQTIDINQFINNNKSTLDQLRESDKHIMLPLARVAIGDDNLNQLNNEFILSHIIIQYYENNHNMFFENDLLGYSTVADIEKQIKQLYGSLEKKLEKKTPKTENKINISHNDDQIVAADTTPANHRFYYEYPGAIEKEHIAKKQGTKSLIAQLEKQNTNYNSINEKWRESCFSEYTNMYIDPSYMHYILDKPNQKTKFIIGAGLDTKNITNEKTLIRTISKLIQIKFIRIITMILFGNSNVKQSNIPYWFRFSVLCGGQQLAKTSNSKYITEWQNIIIPALLNTLDLPAHSEQEFDFRLYQKDMKTKQLLENINV